MMLPPRKALILSFLLVTLIPFQVKAKSLWNIFAENEEVIVILETEQIWETKSLPEYQKMLSDRLHLRTMASLEPMFPGAPAIKELAFIYGFEPRFDLGNFYMLKIWANEIILQQYNNPFTFARSLQKELLRQGPFKMRSVEPDLHYQFEAIHPFTDGNGRTGRILNILYLTQNHLLDLPVLYLSKYIIEQKSEYYRLLRNVTEHQDWEPWILYMLNAVEQTALYTRDKMLAIRALLIKTLEFTKDNLPSRVYSKDLVELLFHQPYTKAQLLVDAGIAERKTAANYLKELVKIGVLQGYKVGKENLFLNKELFEVLSK